MAEIQALAFAGSLRERSYNRALVRAMIERAPDGLTIEAFDLSPLPLYDGDVEAAGDPEPVTALKTAIREADLVLIVTPEYNGGLPAVTKNAVDWASRPPKPQVWDEKPVAILGCSPGRLGTVLAQGALRASLSHLNAHVLSRPRLFIAGAHGLFDEDLRLTDEATAERLDSFVSAAAAWALHFKRS